MSNRSTVSPEAGITSVLKADEISGTVTQVQIDKLAEGASLTVVSEVGTISGTFVGTQIDFLGSEESVAAEALEKEPSKPAHPEITEPTPQRRTSGGIVRGLLRRLFGE